MASIPTLNNRQSLVAGIRNDLGETFRQAIVIFRKTQEKVFKFLPDSKIRTTTYTWKEESQRPEIWEQGKERSYSTLRDRAMQLTKIMYQLSIGWDLLDEEDDQMGDLKTHVQYQINQFGQIPDRVIADYFNSTATIVPSLKTCYDGAVLFSALNGDGGNRGNTVGGNIITSSGKTVEGMLTDIARAQERFLDFKTDNAEMPFFDESMASIRNLYIIAPNSWNRIILEASEGEFLKTDTTNNVSQSNVFKGKFEGQLNPYLTDSSSFYVVVAHPYFKPFIGNSPTNLSSIIANYDNSDIARKYHQNIFYAHLRSSYAPWFPLSIIKVNGS